MGTFAFQTAFSSTVTIEHAESVQRIGVIVIHSLSRSSNSNLLRTRYAPSPKVQKSAGGEVVSQ